MDHSLLHKTELPINKIQNTSYKNDHPWFIRGCPGCCVLTCSLKEKDEMEDEEYGQAGVESSKVEHLVALMKACLDVDSVLIIMMTLGAITLGKREETI